MKKINLHEAKTNLSKLIQYVLDGGEVVICKANKPVAKLIAYQEPKRKRVPGRWKGKGEISDDFDEMPKELMEYFE